MMAMMALADSISTYSLMGLLINQTFTMEALILGVVEYAAMPIIILHYIIVKRQEGWRTYGPEILTGLIPTAPSLGYLYWTTLTFKESKSLTRVHDFVTLTNLIRGVVVSPLMIAAMSYFYLTEVVTPPWQETTSFCDSMHNCVPLGPLSTLLPLIRFGMSLLTIFTGFLEGYQAANLFQSIEIVAFSLPNSTYRAATLILTAACVQEYVLLLLLLILIVNILVERLDKSCTRCMRSLFSWYTMCRTSQSGESDADAERTIITLVSALSSIVGVSVIPANPTENERNPETHDKPGRLKKIQETSTKLSLATLPIFLLANVIVHRVSQLKGFILCNPNNVLSTDQVMFLILYVMYPLAAVSLATILFFRFTFLSSKDCCKYFKTVVNMFTTLATVLSLAALVYPSVFPPGPSKIVLSIQTRDRVDFVDGLTWTQKWNRSSNEWSLNNGSFVSLDNITLKETFSEYPQNSKSSENSTIFLKTTVSGRTEEASDIKIVKPYPPSTDNTSDVACINCPNKDSNYCKRLLYEVKSKNEHIVTCEKAVDGFWSSWSNGPCKTFLEVPKGKPCGTGWQMQTRECLGRKFGGKYCTGRDSNHRECYADECPGLSFFSFSVM